MFDFITKNDECKVIAPISGKLIDISNVKDEVFSKKMMGDGFAIVPNDNEVVAPASGKVMMVFPDGHALGIKTKKGLEIMLHVGIDTCNLKESGMKVLVKQGDKVKQGQKVITISNETMENKNIDLTTMVVFTAGQNFEFKIEERIVKMGEEIIK